MILYTQQNKKVVNSEMEAFSFNVNISVISLSNVTTKDSFGILRRRWFWNCPWFLDLIKNWWRYQQSKRRLPYSSWPLFSRDSDSTFTNVQSSIRLFVCLSVINQNPSTARNHHPSSFNLHPSPFFIHPSSIFIHPSFISWLLSFSVCFFVRCR